MSDILKRYLDTVVLLIFALVLLIGLPVFTNVPEDLMHGLDSPLLFPRIVAWCLIILTGFRMIWITLKEKKVKTAFNFKEAKGFFLLLLCTIVYLFIIPHLGFFISSIFAILGYMYILDRVKWWKALLIAIIASAVVSFSFIKLLNVPLETSIFGL